MQEARRRGIRISFTLAIPGGRASPCGSFQIYSARGQAVLAQPARRLHIASVTRIRMGHPGPLHLLRGAVRSMTKQRWSRTIATALVLIAPGVLAAQGTSATGIRPPGTEGSSNVHIMSHIPLPGGGNQGVPNLGGIEIRTADVEIEQELSRPYAYV